jgi:hypothetical protein
LGLRPFPLSHKFLSGRLVLPSGVHGAFRKIDGLAALRARVLLVELIGKNLLFRTAPFAFAHKRSKILELLKTRAMSRGRHPFFLLVVPTQGRLFGASFTAQLGIP